MSTAYVTLRSTRVFVATCTVTALGQTTIVVMLDSARQSWLVSLARTLYRCWPGYSRIDHLLSVHCTWSTNHSPGPGSFLSPRLTSSLVSEMLRFPIFSLGLRHAGFLSHPGACHIHESLSGMGLLLPPPEPPCPALLPITCGFITSVRLCKELLSLNY